MATSLLASTASTAPFSWYLVGVAVLCLVCLLFMDDTKDHDFSDGIPNSAALTIDHADRSTTTQ